MITNAPSKSTRKRRVVLIVLVSFWKSVLSISNHFSPHRNYMASVALRNEHLPPKTKFLSLENWITLVTSLRLLLFGVSLPPLPTLSSRFFRARLVGLTFESPDGHPLLSERFLRPKGLADPSRLESCLLRPDCKCSHA